MLTDAERVSDVDLAVELSSKFDDQEGRNTARQKRIEEARKSGRFFGNIIHELSWPRTEVLLFLKSRSRALSLHDMDDAVLQKTSTRQIHPVPEA